MALARKLNHSFGISAYENVPDAYVNNEGPNQNVNRHYKKWSGICSF